jgi:glycerol uptake operon antiterminator
MGPSASVVPKEDRRPRGGIYRADKSRTNLSDPTKLVNSPVIAAVNTQEAFETALLAPTRCLFLLTGNPLVLPAMLKRAQDSGKLCLVNMDFIDGLSRDRFAVEFLAASGVAGIVSTRVDTLKSAQGCGLMTVLRTFGIDTAAVTAAKKSLVQFRPDAVEVLPALVAPRVGRSLREAYPELTTIGGGLIETVKEIEALLADGIHAITTSNTRLWLI